MPTMRPTRTARPRGPRRLSPTPNGRFPSWSPSARQGGPS
jgi:hypothetical protein